VGARTPETSEVTRFGPFELDTALLELRCGGVAVHLEPRPLRMLVYLVTHRDRAVSKQELFDAVWPGETVGDAALAGALCNIRRALADDGSRQRWIRTRRRVGYQFVGPVRDSPPNARAAIATQLPGRRIFGSPRRVSMCFVGRDGEVCELETALAPPLDVGAQICVEGLAGVGKTELALQVVERLARAGALPGGIFWLDAEEADLIPAWSGEIADQLGVREGPPGTRARQVLHALERREHPLLVVLDNVAEWRSDRRPTPLPRGPHVSLLVTTRRHNLGAAQFRHIEVGALAVPHDRSLLTALAGADPGPGLDALLAELGGHPLALELAGAFLGSFPAETPCTYLNALRHNADAVERTVADRTPEERTLGETLRATWDRLPDRVRHAWWLASFFETGPVASEIARALGIGVEALRELESVHLVQCDQEGMWMHRLVRDFGQRTTAAPREALAMLLALGPQLVHRKHASPELRRVYQRAVELSAHTTPTDDALRALDGLWHACCLEAAWPEAIEVARRLDARTPRGASPRQRLLAHRAWGCTFFYTGELAQAWTWLESGVDLCRQERALTGTLTDAGVCVLSHAAFCAALCGRPDLALRLIDEAETLARSLSSPTALSVALFGRMGILLARREVESIGRCVAELRALHRDHELWIFDPITSPVSTWADRRVRRRTQQADTAAIREARAALLESRTFILRPTACVLLADACARLGERELGLDLVRDAMSLMEITGERHAEPELWRVRASLATSHDDAVTCLERGLQVALAQGSRLFALRCATVLAELTAGSEAGSASRLQLREIYAEFREGLDLPDLVRARRALTPPTEHLT